MSHRALAIGGGIIALVATVVIVVALAGGGDSTPETTAAPTDPPAAFAGFEELQECLEEQGVEGGFLGGVPGEAVQPDQAQLEALQACEQYMPEGPPPSGFGGAVPPNES